MDMATKGLYNYISTVLLYMRQWVLIFLVGLLKKILNKTMLFASIKTRILNLLPKAKSEFFSGLHSLSLRA
jgi:hypothetical protein